ncbi:MAG: hypothetical protein FJX62_20905 [Alphaproteobacteria bacterium]|nr:hypothetical protein [Alphaproteobacteria bacterium]
MRWNVAWRRLGAIAAVAFALSANSTSAQDIVIEAPAPEHNALSEDEQDALREALGFDALGDAAPRAAARHGAPSASSATWSRSDNRDGSAAMSVKRALPAALPSVWDTSLGADFGLAAPPSAVYAPGRPWGTPAGQDTGAAWANLKLPNLASFDARLGANAPSRIGATLRRTVPVGGGNAITLETGYAVSETLAVMPASDGTPAPGAAAAPASDRVWSTARAVKLDIGATGTTFAASAANSSANNITRNRLSAEQKLTDALSLTAAVTDPGAPTAGKSIGAAFKWKW